MMNAYRILAMLLAAIGGSIVTSTALSLANDAAELAKISADVFSDEQRAEARGAIDRDIKRRTGEFNQQHREQWYKIQSREQWEKYRDERIAHLRQSLADFPTPAKPNVHVTNVLEGDGFKIENIVFETRPGYWVVGNLYAPAQPRESMPGILLAHAHHRGKVQNELQDMGMTWARAGCLVLVIDQFGYGERRTHPFHRDADFAKPYKTGRQDYFFRYDTGVQLQLMGDSLMGWMAWDLMRGVDVLLARQGIDPKRIILMGGVAGGGDPAGVTAALDSRIACCVPFNFGGPQPETRYPLPDDAETSFNYLLFTYWDSTRGLRLGAKDDFPHWVITASTAPRYLIHGHEFVWDKERDPVWKRYQKVWGEFYGAADRVGVAHGKGLLKQSPPEASHCGNIGKFHRRMIHPLLDQWFGIKVTENDAYSAPRPSEELNCWTEKAVRDLQPKSPLAAVSDIARQRIEKARQRHSSLPPTERRNALRDGWSKLLGSISPDQPAVELSATIDEPTTPGITVERIVLETDLRIRNPLLVIRGSNTSSRAPVVIGVAQAGKAGFLKERADELIKLVKAGAIVVLPDLRGIGESRSGSSRGRSSQDTSLSTYVQLFGETLLGERLRDLRSVIAYLRTRPDVDAKRLALWGDSFTPPNPADTNFKVPHDADGWPSISEPLGGLLAMLGALYEDDVRAVYVAGGLDSYHNVLKHFAVLIPHDASVPGALTTGDLADLAGGLAPKPLRLEALVNHLNQPASQQDLDQTYAVSKQAYSSHGAALRLSEKRTPAATWLLEQLR